MNPILRTKTTTTITTTTTTILMGFDTIEIDLVLSKLGQQQLRYS